MGACGKASQAAPEIKPNDKEVIAKEIETPPQGPDVQPTQEEPSQTEDVQEEIKVIPPSEDGDAHQSSIKKSRFAPNSTEDLG